MVHPDQSSHERILDVSVSIDLCETRLRIAGREFKLNLPRQPERIIGAVAQLADADRSQTDPYWGILWPSCSVMAELLLNTEWPPGLRVLELGCGSGLLGIAALMKGMQVTFSDIVSDAVGLAVENADLNSFSSVPGLVFNWRQAPALTFDLILANDVLYASELHAALLSTIEMMLAPGGQCWIGDPGRTAAKDFIHQASDHGLGVGFRDATGRIGLFPSAGEFQVIVLTRPASD